MSAFRKATKKKQRLRVAIIGPPGSGKTWSSLEIATGLGGRIGMIDSERGSGELYSDHFKYDVDFIYPPFTPEKYIEMIHEAGSEGFDNLIIDSISHAWMGEGGLVEIADRLGGNSKSPFGGWRQATPMQNKLVNAMLDYPGNLIVTLRTKTAYEIQETATGKKMPVKIGLAPVQREGMEYEFSVVFSVQEDHTAIPTKDRTHLFKDIQPFIITKKTGELISSWLETGEDEDETFLWVTGEALKSPDPRAWYLANKQLLKSFPKHLKERIDNYLIDAAEKAKRDAAQSQ